MMEHCGLKCSNILLVASVIYTSYSQIAWLIPVLLLPCVRACECVCVCVWCDSKTIFNSLETDQGERLKDSK